MGLEGGHLRLLVLRVVTHPLFDVLILLAIGVSSCMLAAETHTFPREGTETFEAFFIVNVLFTMLFTAEMAAKVYAFGLYGNSGAYLKSSSTSSTFWSSSLAAHARSGRRRRCPKSVRLLRALRPLRSIHRLPALKVVINAVIECLPAIAHVGLLGFGLGTVLSIMGMELFRGKMWYCAWLRGNDDRSRCGGQRDAVVREGAVRRAGRDVAEQQVQLRQLRGGDVERVHHQHRG